MTLNLTDLDLKAQSRIVVAMSGGIDSSVVACLLKEAKYDVIGITLQLYSQKNVFSSGKSCCSGQDIYDAKQVAMKMNFPHYVLNYEDIFKKHVVNNFIDEYKKGKTPVPCTQCNQIIKFQHLLKTAKDLNASAMATGHYVRRIKNENTVGLYKSVDHTKDQSYFLWGTTEEELKFLRFPLGDLNKSTTRLEAKRFCLSISNKPDSQDICFIPNRNYRSFISKDKDFNINKGYIIHIDGRIIGRHEGICFFTIGQKKGLNINSTNKLYVVDIKNKKNKVIVGPKEMLHCKTIFLKSIKWINSKLIQFNLKKTLLIKVRSSGKLKKASIFLQRKGLSSILIKDYENAPSKGQACVFYMEEQILGGGWVKKTIPLWK